LQTHFGEPTFKSVQYGLQIFSVNGNASTARKTHGILISLPGNGSGSGKCNVWSNAAFPNVVFLNTPPSDILS
jgi:hypothetical protein